MQNNRKVVVVAAVKRNQHVQWVFFFSVKSSQPKREPICYVFNCFRPFLICFFLMTSISPNFSNKSCIAFSLNEKSRLQDTLIGTLIFAKYFFVPPSLLFSCKKHAKSLPKRVGHGFLLCNSFFEVKLRWFLTPLLGMMNITVNLKLHCFFAACCILQSVAFFNTLVSTEVTHTIAYSHEQ